jgi:hypothetical protein
MTPTSLDPGVAIRGCQAPNSRMRLALLLLSAIAPCGPVGECVHCSEEDTCSGANCPSK